MTANQPDFFPLMPRRLSHAEIMAGFAELRRVMALPDFPLRYGGRPLPSGDVGGSTAPRKCGVPGDAFAARPDYDKMNEAELTEEAKRVCTALRKAPSKKQWRFAEKLCGDSRHLRVREFMVIDGTKFKGGAIQSVAYHVAGGIWKGYNIPFEEFVEFLNAHPEKDEELMMSIYGV